MKYDEVSRQNIEQLKQLKLRTPYGQYIDLQDVATIEVKEGPVAIRSVDQAHAVALTVKYGADYSLGDMSDKVDEIIEQGNMREFFVTFGRRHRVIGKWKSDMILAVLLAVSLVYMVMAAQFESFKFPFVIMFTVPLIVIGIFIGLFTTSVPISISAVIGILILVGIVVNTESF